MADFTNEGYSFDLTADKLSFTGTTKPTLTNPNSADTLINVSSGSSTITATNGVSLDKATIQLMNTNIFGENFNGSLSVNGDLSLTDSLIVNDGQANFNVNGKVSATNTTFVAGVSDLSRVTSNGFYIMSASKGFQGSSDTQKITDTAAGNIADLIIHKQFVNVSSNLLDSKYAGGTGTINRSDLHQLFENQDLNALYDAKLVEKGNALYVDGSIKNTFINTNKTLDAKALNAAIKTEFQKQKTALEALYKYDSANQAESGLFATNKQAVNTKITEYTKEGGTIATSQKAVDEAKAKLDEANKGTDQSAIKTAQEAYNTATQKLESDKKTLNELNNRLAQYNSLIAQIKNQTTSLNTKLDANYDITAGQKGQIFASLATSNVGGKIAGTANYIFDDGRVINDIEKSARSTAGNSALNSPVGAINMSNDMAISNRLAKFSNPYSTMGIGEKFAAGNGIASDSTYAYGARSYDNNVWANVIGGANIIDSNSGALYGVSAGYDRLVGEDTILGAYLTYANSEVKTSLANQESDNLQLGLYTRTLYGNSEFDFKSYAQFGWTDQDRFIAGTTNSSDFTRKFLGASGTYGYVFDMGNDLYIKPLAGLNLYYSFTPDYNENGAYAQHVRSQTNFDASIEAGAEFRKYLSKESYVYATPKIEQYVITSGDDYTARFLGSPTSFTINGSDKKKTYGSFIVGGDINIKDQWAFTFAAGVKHLLSGKINDESETYLSGNVGLKYQF